MDLEALRQEQIDRCKKGANFIMAAAVMWFLFFLIWRSPFTLESKAVLNLWATGVLFPLALLIARIMKAEWKLDHNPLSKLGLVINLTQMLYYPIIFWAFYRSPENMPMFFAIITGAHLLPFSWLYKSKAYMVMAVVMSLGAAIIGWNLSLEQLWIIPLALCGLLLGLAIWLLVEVRAETKATA